MRKCIPLVITLVAVVFICKKTNFTSYTATLWAQAHKEVKEQIPARLEIERVRYEISNLDGDLGNMIRPIAEHMAALTKLRKDIQTTQIDIENRREILLKMTRDLAGNPQEIEYGGKLYPAELIRSKLNGDFESFKRLEAKLQSQNKLIQAKEASLRAAQDQLAKVTAKKREYEVRLAQLEADEESLQLARMGTPFKLDDSRASQIESALVEIERRQNVQRAEIELRSGSLVNDSIPVGKSKESAADLTTIQRHLEAPPALATAVKVGKN